MPGDNAVGTEYMSQAVAGEGVDKFLTFAAAGTYTVKPYERNIQVTVGASMTGTVALPSAGMMRGAIVSIRVVSVGSSGIVAITGSGLVSGQAQPNLTALEDYCVVYSDGHRWYVLGEIST